MYNFYLIIIFLGLILLYMNVRKFFLIKSINKKMYAVDNIFLNSNKRKIGLLNNFKRFFLNYFSPLYNEKGTLKIKNILILSFLIILALVLNEIFLRLPLFVVLIVSLIWGIYIIKVIEFKIIAKEFEETFPKALVILNGAISSGSNITQALDDCANSLEGIIAREFKTIVRSLNLGEDPSKVFSNSFSRLPFKNYYFFLMALLVSIKSGAKLKEILSRLSSATTKAKAMEKKKESMTSEARMSSKITAAIPFIFLFLMKFISPDNFDYILYDEKGRYILYYFLTSEVIGMSIILFLMRKI